MNTLTVSELTIYPLKSARGIKLKRMQLGARGPEMDRRWMLVNKRQEFVTQRKTPKICLINTELSNTGLTLSADGYGQCQASFGGGHSIQSEVWGAQVTGEDCGDNVAQWLSEFLGIECRMIFMPETMMRLVDVDYAHNEELVGFADGFPLLLASQASIDDFNTKLATPISMNRFRPNIVISGSDKAYAEDHWQELKINDIKLSLVKPCSRCIMPSVDPETGLKQMAVNDALLKYRRRNKKTYFGQNAIYDRLGEIRLNDDITVLR